MTDFSFNTPQITDPVVYCKNVRFISDHFYFNNIASSNILSVIPTVGIGINTKNPRAQLDVIGSIVTSSNVGIGTYIASNMLSVFGSTAIGTGFSNSIAPQNGLAVFGNVGIGTVTACNNLSVSGTVAIGSDYSNVIAPTNSLVVSGNFGVGVSNPVSKAAISGSLSVGQSYTNVISPTDSIIVSGNIGVGVTSPKSKMTVSGGVSIGTSFINYTSPSDGLIVSGNTGIGTNVAASVLSVGNNVSIGSFYTQVSAPPNGMIVYGNVGIGVTDPGSKLSVSGTVSIGSAYSEINTSGVTDSLIVSGNIGVGTAIPASALTVTNGGVSIGNAYSSFKAPTDSMIVSGGVGIGITNQNQNSKLCVAGTAAFGTSFVYTPFLPVNTVIFEGNVGLGTNAPTSKASVCGGINIGAPFSNAAAPTDGMIVSGHVGIGITNPYNNLSVVGNSAIGATFGYSNAPTSGLIVEGNVGIGTTNPLSKVVVLGGVSVGNNLSVPNGDLSIAGNIGAGSNISVLGYGEIGCNLTVTGNIIGFNSLEIFGNARCEGTLSTSNLNVFGSVTTLSSYSYESSNFVINNLFGSATALSVTQGLNSSYPVADFSSSNSVVPYLRISSNGNIGINTASPIATLDVWGNFGISNQIVVDSNTNVFSSNITAFGNIGINTASPIAALDVWGNFGVSNNTVIDSNTNVFSSNITAFGNIGINTASPNAALSVWGNIGVSNNTVIDSNTNVFSSNITAFGNIGINTASPIAALDVWGNFGVSNKVVVDCNTNVFSSNITAFGNIGINTASPNATLSIWGNVGVSNKIVIDSNTNIFSSNITSYGNVSGKVSTAAQPYIKTLPAVLSVGSNESTQITGTILTPSQPYIQYLAISPSSNIGIGTTFANAKLDVAGNIAINGINVISGNTSISTSNLSIIGDGNVNGTIGTGNQPYITTLCNVTVIGNSDTIVSGIIQTQSQPNIKLLSGNIGISTSTPQDTLDVWGNVAIAGTVFADSTHNIYANDIHANGLIYGTLASTSFPNIQTLSGVTSVGSNNSTSITGTLQTANQPNIQYVAVNSLAFGIGTSNPSPFSKLDVTGNISINGNTLADSQSNIYSKNIYGNVAHPIQPLITSLPNIVTVGNSTSLFSGTILNSSQSNIKLVNKYLCIGDSLSISSNINLNVAGNIGICNVIVADTNSNLYGYIRNSNQPYITSIPNLTSIGSDGTIITGIINTSNQPNITILGTQGNVGINSTSPQYNLDVDGHLGVSGNIYAGGVYGTLINPFQQLVLRLGDLDYLNVGSYTQIGNVTNISKYSDLTVTRNINAFGSITATGNGTIGNTLTVGNLVVNGAITSSSSSSSSTGFQNISVQSTVYTSNVISSNINVSASSSASLMQVIQGNSNSVVADFYSSNLLALRVSNTGIITSNINASGTIYASNIVIGGASGFFLSCNVTSNFTNSTTTAPNSYLLYNLTCNIVNNSLIADVNVNVNETKTGSGLYNIVCTANGNASSYSWVLSNVVTNSVISSGTGASPYVFSNVSFSPSGSKTISVTGTVQNNSSGIGNTAKTNATFTANALETLNSPYVNVNNVYFSAPQTVSVDSVNYYTSNMLLQFNVGYLSFSNLVNVYPYSGTNFMTINNTNTFSWNSLFTSSPTNASAVSNTKVITVGNVTGSTLPISVSNVLGSVSCNINIAYVPPTIPTPTFTFTNSLVSNVARVISGNDMIYAPLKNNFVTSSASAVNNCQFYPSTTSITGKTTLNMMVTPITGTILNSFGVGVYSNNVTDVKVSWSNISSTYFSASTSWMSGGCGNGIGNSTSPWYIRIPSSLSQNTYSPIYIQILTSGDIPIPVII